MGMYTTVKHGHIDLQIKSGRDNLEVYELGDTVNWFINENYGGDGTLLDDVYYKKYIVVEDSNGQNSIS